MKLLSLFSGIGAFEKALDKLEVPYELVGYCEIDKYASKSYSAIHGVPEAMNLGDITKVDENSLPKDIDLCTYGFPCQDISLAGKQKGLFNADGSQTRSGLFFEALRIIEATKPKVAIAENVKNLTSKKFAEQFQIVLSALENAGYNNYWKVLNAKDFGIPQNRERVFIVSIRKDIDTGSFQFPSGFPLQKRLKDMLQDESEVDSKYFISLKGKKFILNPMRIQKKYTAINGDVSLCLTAKGQTNLTGTFVAPQLLDEEPAVIQLGKRCPTATRENPNQGRIYSVEGISPALNCMSGGNRQPFIFVKEATKLGYAAAAAGDSVNLEQMNSKTRRGRVGHQVAQTLTTSCNQGVVVPSEEDLELLDLRRFTAKECFRLMGFDDADFDKAEAVNSNTQLYKQAGNSIVVPVPQYIIKSLIDAHIFDETKEEKPMELKINAMAIPEPITFNYEELKAELLQKVSIYESMVYTDDQIKVAKKDRASLNSLKKALNDERLRREREYMQPFNIFKSQIQEIIQIIDKPCAVIDKQIKAFEDLQKQEKLESITSYWNESNHPAEVAFDQIFDGRWLNASVTMKTIQDAIDAKVAQITADLAVIDDLPAFSLEAKATYLQTLDLGKAVAQSHRLTELAEQQKAREAELEARKAQEEAKPVQVEAIPEAPAEAPAKAKEPERKWIPFQCYLSAEEAKALGSFLKANGIQYKKI